VVEQLIRNQQARGSTPRAGSRDFRVLAGGADLFFFWGSIWGSIIEGAGKIRKEKQYPSGRP
jgi:hypothetical protein